MEGKKQCTCSFYSFIVTVSSVSTLLFSRQILSSVSVLMLIVNVLFVTVGQVLGYPQE